MPLPPIRVLLAGPDPEEAGRVRDMLSSPGERRVFTVEYAGSLLSALDALAGGSVDIILLDLYLPDSRGLETLLTVRAHAPQVPVLVWAGLDSSQLAQGAVQAGAQDYLVKDRLSGAALARTLEYAIFRDGNRASAPATAAASVMTGLLGAKGGVGTTTVACHLSAELRRLTDSPVLLADLDLYAGQVAFLMKADSAYSILDAANNLHRLDKDYWAALVAKGTGGVSVIRSPGLRGMQSALSTDRVRHMFRFLRPQYRWMVMDLGRASALSLEVAADLNQLILVATADVQSLFEAKQVLARLAEMGIPGDRLRIVLNRFPGRAGISRADVERILDQPVHAALPNNYAALSEAYSNGSLLPEACGLRQHIARLAAGVAGLDPEPAKRKNSLLGFLKRPAAPLNIPETSGA
jgi:pilus assembly protein CpaE